MAHRRAQARPGAHPENAYRPRVRGQEPERSQRARRANIDVARVEELMLARQDARASKDFALSDSLRQEIIDLGVSVRDTPEGQIWDLE